MKIDTNISVPVVTVDAITNAINALNGRHRVNVNGEGWKELVDHTAIIITIGNELTKIGKEIEENELLPNMPRPINVKNNKPLGTVHIDGVNNRLTVTFKENPEPISNEAKAKIIALAMKENSIESVFELKLKKVNFDNVSEKMAALLTSDEVSYTTKETKSMASPKKL